MEPLHRITLRGKKFVALLVWRSHDAAEHKFVARSGCSYERLMMQFDGTSLFLAFRCCYQNGAGHNSFRAFQLLDFDSLSMCLLTPSMAKSDNFKSRIVFRIWD